MKRQIRVWNGILVFLALLAMGCSEDPVSSTPATASSANNETINISTLPVEDLSDAEKAGILFMREEEKLARDTYRVLGDLWNQRVFSNISRSEQRHMDAVKQLIDRYELEDPVQSDEVGVFVNTTLKALYDSLSAAGKESLEQALRVGCAIEEIDIVDLQRQLSENVDNQDITLIYENLMRGSRNHLRAFVKNLSNLGVTYEPQFLSREDFDAIINSPMERGPGH